MAESDDDSSSADEYAPCVSSFDAELGQEPAAAHEPAVEHEPAAEGGPATTPRPAAARSFPSRRPVRRFRRSKAGAVRPAGPGQGQPAVKADERAVEPSPESSPAGFVFGG